MAKKNEEKPVEKPVEPPKEPTSVMPKASLGIKESLEVLAMLKVVGVAAAKVGSDHDVNMADIKHLVELAKKFSVIHKGVEDIDKVMVELKDLDKGETMELGSASYDLIKEVYKNFVQPTLKA